MRGRRSSIPALVAIPAAFICVLILHLSAVAQELRPRAYWPAPNGTKAVVLNYEYSTGDVLTDPSLPITGLESSIHALMPSYFQTFSLFGRTANARLGVPFVSGKSEGFYEEQPRSREITGIGDVQVSASINILGAPTIDFAGFQELVANPRTVVGTSLTLRLPTGIYETDRLINVGANRWALKPDFGVIWPFHPTWMLEFEAGVWLFGDNDEFLGATREQEPILSTELHLIKRVGPGFWAALDVNYYHGGRSTVGEETKADLQRNSRLGGTVFFPFKRYHAIRASYSAGIVTESGSDFEKLTLGYHYVWR
jgi:hypothetical protein